MLILTVAIFVSGITYIVLQYRNQQHWAYIFKPLTMLLIIALAVMLMPISSAYQWLIIVGLLFSTMGDILLMLPKDRFIYGLISFLIAHLLYIVAFLGLAPLALNWPVLLIFLIFTAVFLRLILPFTGKLKIPVILYAFVIATMGVLAINAYLATGSNSTLAGAIGACLFICSDTFLALNKFVKPFASSTLWVMITYYSAQYLIALSVGGLY